jgi:formylglycine-generating enzyme required for sulfatase activity
MKGRKMISVRGVAWSAVVAVALCVTLASAVSATVNIETVTVGDPGNAGELSGAGAGGHGPDRICGAVAYTYNIGKYEVTAGQYTEFLNAVAKTDIYVLYRPDMSGTWAGGSGIERVGSQGSYAYYVDANFVNRPVNYVSWGNAARFANWLTNGQPTGAQNASTTEDGSYYLNGATSNAALLAVPARKANAKYVIPTEDEWYKAAYYKGGGINAGYWDYATSSDTAPGRDMADASGNNANCQGLPYPIAPPDPGLYTTVAGEFQNSDSPYGTFDQSGNVWEWNEDIVAGAYRVLRGGSFYSNDFYLRATYRYDDLSLYYGGPSFVNAEIGFRVAEVPEPATLSLLVVGGLLALRRRR